VAVPVTTEVLPEPPDGAPPGGEPPEGGTPVGGLLPGVPVPGVISELAVVDGDIAVVVSCGLHEVNIIANTIREPKIKQTVF
jgi:hypothetical protein